MVHKKCVRNTFSVNLKGIDRRKLLMLSNLHYSGTYILLF